MPINYSDKNRQPFSLNWGSLFDCLEEFNFFRKDTIQKQFLTQWIQRLQSDEINSYNEIEAMNLNTIEHFPLKIMFGNLFLGWSAINIDKTEQVIYQNQVSPSKIDLSYFLSEDIYQKETPYERTNKILYYSSFYSTNYSYIPVLIFSPTFNNPYDRVIDGNHRIEFATKNNITTLDCYLLTEHFFISNHNCFLDSFSKSLFLFMCDLYFFWNTCNNRQHLKNRIFQSSESRHFLRNSHIYLT